MAARLGEQEFQHRIQRIESLIHEVEALVDRQAQASAEELVQALLDLHGAGLDRILALLRRAGQAGDAIVEDLIRDDRIASLLLLHGLHPLDLDTRVRRALEKLRPHLGSQGSRVELLGLAEGVARVRLEVESRGCGSSSVGAVQQIVEEALYEAAPDLAGIEVEGAPGTILPSAPASFISLAEMLGEDVPSSRSPNGTAGLLSMVNDDRPGG